MAGVSGIRLGHHARVEGCDALEFADGGLLAEMGEIAERDPKEISRRQSTLPAQEGRVVRGKGDRSVAQLQPRGGEMAWGGGESTVRAIGQHRGHCPKGEAARGAAE